MLHAQQYIEYIRNALTLEAIEYAQIHLNQFDKETIYSLDKNGIPSQTPIEVKLLPNQTLFIIFEETDCTYMLPGTSKKRTWTLLDE